MKSNSIKFEISFLYTLILGAILAGFSYVLYIILSLTIYHEMDSNLLLKAQEISSSIRAYADMKGGKPEELAHAAQAIISEEHRYLNWWWAMGSGRRWVKQAKKIDVSEGYINFVTADGKLVTRSRNINRELLRLFLKDGKEFKNSKPSLQNLMYRNQKIRVINFPFVYKDQTVYVVQVGISQQPIAQLLQSWLYSILLSIPVILLLTSFIGWLLVSRFLRPVQNIIDTAQKISVEDLNSRVKQEDYAVEMKSLVDAFNGMIGRLEKSFNHIEEFSSLVAHELKTPLTIIRGETELALRGDGDSKEYRRTLKIVGNESQRMLKTIEDLLYLAKLDYQPEFFKFAVIDFKQFFQEIIDDSRMLASTGRIRVQAELPPGPLLIKADHLHLRRLFFNVIDNALKFTPPGGRIEMAVAQQDSQAVATISDSGKGISEQNLEKIFEKFFREDNQQDIGCGLGLSIVQSIVKIHQGTIRVSSKLNQGTTFIISLPLTDQPGT